MKKILAIILAVAMCLSLGTAAFAAEDVILIAPAPAKGVNVTVTIADAGNLVLVQAPVCVTDLDADGTVSINDALIAAHAAYYKDGAAGYAYYSGDYGLAMDTLWGVANGGSYMYYVNDLMPMSLGEAVNEGDSVVAYGFADLEYWSDAYSFFDKKTAAVTAGDTVELTLSTPDWEGNIMPVAGADIYVGTPAGVATDENGKAAVTMDKVGSYVVSAKSETAVLVPPVCKVTVGFTDVADGDAYAAAINYLVTAGLVNGIEGTAFNAAAAIGRGDFAALIWNLEGAPVVNYLMMFQDVAAEEWYTEAVRWAAAEGIVEGYSDTKCAPLDELTREQAAVILWRYAKHEGIDVSAAAAIDTAEVSEWAVEAVQWACGAGLISADEPGAALTRGEAAQLIYEFAAYIG